MQNTFSLRHVIASLVLAAGAAATPAHAALAPSVLVPATGDIWLAGQPDGTTATGNFGSDDAPAQSPTLFPASVLPGHSLTFSAAGSTSVDNSCFAGPDGGCYADESVFGVGPAFGIGTYKGPSNALIGVFLDNNLGAGTGGPASLDYTLAVHTGLLIHTPGLNQIFYIGDGLTGTGDGVTQQFVVPVGAARLYLAVADSYGSSLGNPGSLTVTFSDIAPVPEPETWAMLLMGLASVGIAVRRRARQP